MNTNRLNVYQIVVRGTLDTRWSDWFGGLAIAHRTGYDGRPVTTMSGAIVDQAALRDTLCKLWDLNLVLISVHPIEMDTTRFEKLSGRSGLVFALILGSLVFGLGHTYQGLDAVLANAIQGLLFALVYLRKRAAWEPVVAHAVYDLIGITLGFLIYA
jgi:hypothetical protein